MKSDFVVNSMARGTTFGGIRLRVYLDNRVRTKNRNHFSRTFQGLCKDQIEFSRTPYQEVM